MGNYIIRRVLTYLLVIFCISLISFTIIRLAPGDPAEMMVDPETPKEVIEAKREALGLNDPLYVQYFSWLKRAVQGDLGYSVLTHQKVTVMIGERIGPTMILVFSSLFLAVMIAIPLGVFSAVHQNSPLDHATSGSALLFISTPMFFISLVLVYVFALKLRWFPTGGMHSLGANNDVLDLIKHMILPMLALAINSTGVLVRYVRPSMLEILGQDYLRTAKAKGLSRRRVIYKHGLRNALNSVVTVLGVQIAYQMGGSVVIEKIFSWPGLGKLTYDAVLGRDYAVVMGINLLMGIIVLMVNLITDIVYVIIDPRIKLS